MVKWIGIILFFSACCYFGETSSRRLFRRRNFLGEMALFTGALKSKIRFTGEEIFAAVRESAASYSLINKYFGSFDLGDFAEFSGAGFEEAWCSASAEAAAGSSLTVDDLNLLCGLGKGLGTTDTEGQIAHISMYEELFRESYLAAKEEAKIKGRLYRICGVCAGAAFALLFL